VRAAEAPCGCSPGLSIRAATGLVPGPGLGYPPTVPSVPFHTWDIGGATFRARSLLLLLTILPGCAGNGPGLTPRSAEVSGRGAGAADPDTECFLAALPESTTYDVAPTPATQVTPRYPEFARDAQIQGTVVLRLFIDSSGRTCAIKLLKGVTGLNEAAIDAVRQWTFNPATLNGVPVAAWVDIPMSFHF
jgi:TonB family protein